MLCNIDKYITFIIDIIFVSYVLKNIFSFLISNLNILLN
jgi:hypothetical protein